MRFYTSDECETWLKDRKRLKPDVVERSLHLRIPYLPEPQQIYYMARWSATQLTQRRPALLWITEWGIWGGENWHLYYRLRQSYGDHRLLHEAPGHLFLDFETDDLASFIELSMLNGWGGYVLNESNYANLFFSHDEFIDFFSEDKGLLDQVEKELGGGKKDLTAS